MERYAFPIRGEFRVNRIQREDVLRVLTPIWARKPETARRVRQRIRSVLRWTHAYVRVRPREHGRRGGGRHPSVFDDQSGTLFRALPYTGVPRALDAVRESPASLHPVSASSSWC